MYTFKLEAFSLCVLFVNVNDLLDFVVAAHEDTRAIVNGLGYHLDHAIHLAVDCLSAS